MNEKWQKIYEILRTAWAEKALAAGVPKEEVDAALKQDVNASPEEKENFAKSFIKDDKARDIFLTAEEQQAKLSPEDYKYFHENKDLGKTSTETDPSGNLFGVRHLAIIPKVNQETAATDKGPQELYVKPNAPGYIGGAKVTTASGQVKYSDLTRSPREVYEDIKAGKLKGMKWDEKTGHIQVNETDMDEKIAEPAKEEPKVEPKVEPVVEPKAEEKSTEPVVEPTPEAGITPKPEEKVKDIAATIPDWKRDWRELTPIEEYKK